MPNNQYALTLEDMQLERSQRAFFGQYGGFTPADTAGLPVRAAVSMAQGMNTESVARDAAAARQLSLPVETVRSNPQETSEELNTRRLMQDQGMASFASRSPEHAALIVDDPDAWEKVWRRVRAMPDAIGQAWDIGKHNQQYAALGKEFLDASDDKLEGIRSRMVKHRKERQAMVPVDSYADEIALTSAVEQLPRMAEMLPKQAAGAALAGMAGAVGGAVASPAGAVAGFGLGARTGWLAATAYSAFEEERNSTIADFALLQDEEGQYMSREDVVGAATIYAAGAAAIETAGEAFFLSLAKPFLGGLASKIAPKAFLKTAVQRAMQNKSTRAAVLDLAKRVGQNALGEGGEESLQGLLQDVMQVVAMAKSDEHGNTSFGEQTVFKTETVKNLAENFGAGFGAGLWLGGVPMITLGAQDVVAAHRADLWAKEQKALHAEVEATKVKAASPELTRAMLEEGPNLEGNAVIPADALMELHQQDEIILPALGMEEKAVQQAAEMGQEITVPLARLHASLNQQQADAVLDIAREEPQAMSAAEARRLTDRLRTMGERAIAETAGRTEELRARDMEVERLREEMTRAVDSVPGLRARLESGEGLQGEAGGVAQFVEDNLRVAVGMARYLADETGRPIAEFLRPITYEGLDVNSRGQLVPMYKIREEMESEEERARAETDRPFWELVWGRVDPESLKTDYAETYKELRKSKRGLFMPAGRGGVPLDQIADELNERGIFTGSADDLLELLKTKERPRRGYYQEGELTEEEPKTEEPTEEEQARLLAAEIEARAKRIEAEINALSAGYDSIIEAPLAGNADDVLASIGREDIEEAFDVLRGPAIEVEGEIIVQGKRLKNKTGSKGHGLVKIIYRHGEKGNKTPAMPIVTKEDVLRLPELVREYAPAVKSAAKNTWHIPREDGLVFVIVSSQEEGPNRLVTLYNSEPEGLELSQKRNTAAESSGSMVYNAEDTAQELTSSPESQEAVSAQSIAQGGEEVNSLYQRDIPENPLVTVHNLTAENILFADKLGGLPVPSLGVTKADTPYTGFGNITLIGTRDMVDPANTPVFSNDAYTARFPRVVWQAAKGKAQALLKKLQPYFRPELERENYRLRYDLEEGPKDKDDLERMVDGSPAVQSMFLKSKGIEVQDVMKRPTERAMFSLEPEVQAVVQGVEEARDIEEGGEEHKRISDAFAAVSERKFGENKIYIPGMEQYMESGLLTYTHARRLFKAAVHDKAVADRLEFDAVETQRAMSDLVRGDLREEYNAFVEDLLEGFWTAPQIKVKGKTVPLDLENVVKAMTAGKSVRGAEETMNVSPGMVRAMVSEEFKTMEDMLYLRDYVGTEAEADQAKKDSDITFKEYQDLAVPEHSDPASWAAFDDVMLALIEAAKKKPTKARLKAALKKYGVANPSAAVLDAGMEALDYAQDIVVQYFEAKPQRAVQLSEFRGAIVPSDAATPELLEVLNNAGLKVKVYDYAVMSRKAAVRELAYDLAAEQEGVLYQFIGEEGAARLDETDEASTRMDNLDVARQMEEAGKEAAAIKLATGWERGADGKWRYEIDDSQVQVFPDGDRTWRQTDPAYTRFYELNDAYGTRELTPEEEAEYDELEQRYDAFNDVRKHFRQALEAGKLKLKDILGADDVFSAYPDIAELPVRFDELSGTALGAYTGEAILLNDRLIGRVNTAAQLKPILLHEVQHAIQDKEGFARGGSAANMWIGEARQHTAKLYKEKLKPLSLEEYARQAWRTDEITDELRADYQDYLKTATSRQADRAAQEGAAREAYRRLAGETEARNTASRMTMTYEERLASLASQTEDVARKDQIFLRDALGRAMAMGESRTKGVTRGETVFTPNAMGMDYVVRLFKHANLSTLAHESSHVFFLQMKQLVDAGEASPRMQADYAALCRWVGSKDGYLNRDQHEKLAKGMELFLREGKAPSKKLEGAFGRFRRWLTEVYKAITGPYFQDEQGRQITLNPEVRDVFSRILATQEEVARQAADEVIGRDFTAELDRLGVTGAQRVAITGLVKEAKDMAETRLHEAREAGRKAMQAKWKKEAEAQVAEERIYKARKAMRNSGMNMLALASAVGNEAAGEFFRKLPGIRRDGANPWAFAASFGYDSVDQMVQEMLTTPSKAERVEQLVAQKQAEHDKQFKAQSLIASDQAAAMEEMVQEHIIKAMGGKERGVALAQIKQAAREYLAGLSMDEAINSGKFRYQAVRLMHLEREAIMAQDYARAMDINFKLRLNMELTRQSQELRDKTYGVARRAAKFCASKIHTPVCRYAVAFLGMKAGLLPGSKMITRTAQDKDLSMVKAWAAEATDYGYTFEMDEELWYADINPWRHMSLSYFDRVYRQLTQIMTIEQNMRKMDTWQGQQELASVSADLHLHIFGNDPTRQKVGVESDSPKVRRLKKFFNQMLTVATRLKLWDDDKPMGKAWNLIMRPMQEARADELRRFEKASKQIRQIINETYSHAELMAMKDKAFDQALGESVSKEERLLVLLNMGNAGNRNRLKEGFRQVKNRNKWSDAEIEAMVAPLEKKDYDFAQKIWDHFEQYKKERFDQEESLTGVRPLEVEATPLQTKYGTYRGGYFPIKYDTDRGARAASLDKVNKAAVSMLPSVAHGAMKDRQDKGLGTPLKLRFSVITDAVAESVHDLAFRRPVIEVSKLLRQHPVQEAMEGTQGALVYKQMWDWLNDIAGERPAQNSLDNVASWARSRMAIFAMGFKLTTTLAQASGLLATSTQLGWKYTLRGVHDVFRHGGTWSAREVWEDTQARSVTMKNRLQSFDRDVLALTKDLTEAGSSNRFLDPIFRADDWVKKHAFTLTGWVQLWAADLPTWRGAFLKGLEELGMDEKEAALYADTMVETAQGSGATKDLSEIMRGDGMTQLLTVFYSYFNALYNMFYRSATMARRHKDLPHVMHTASMALVLWFVEPALTAMLTNKGPDDDEEWWEWWLKEGVQQPFQMIVGVRDISNMIWNSIEGKFGQGYRFSPAADIIEAFGKTAIDLGRVVENVGEGDYEGTKKAAKSLSRDIGMISGTPLLGAQMQTTLGNMWDWLDGSEEFNLQDLFFTRKK